MDLTWSDFVVMFCSGQDNVVCYYMMVATLASVDWHQVAVPEPSHMSHSASPGLLIFQAVGETIFTNMPSQSLIKIL